MPGEGLKFTEGCKQAFLDDYAKRGLFIHASEVAGVNEQTVRDHMKGDPAFNDAVKAAYKKYCEALEESARVRAMEGDEHDVYHMGMVVGTKKIRSDRLHELFLKRHIPEFREKSTVDVNHQGGVLIAPMTEQDVRQWREDHLKETPESPE